MIHMSPTRITTGLYIGDIDDVRRGDTSDFDLVVGVCQDSAADNVGCEYIHYNMSDGDDQQGHNPGEYSYEMFTSAVETVLAARIRRETVLVHCHVGRSRSVAVVAAALAILEGETFDDALSIIHQNRYVQPTRTLVEDGRRFVEERS